jgi:filamentous hemagglutinin
VYFQRLTLKFSSYGGGGKEYAKETKKMISEGRYRDAMAREVKDIRNASQKGSGNRKKYNACIKEMLKYAKRMGHLPPKK